MEKEKEGIRQTRQNVVGTQVTDPADSPDDSAGTSRTDLVRPMPNLTGRPDKRTLSVPELGIGGGQARKSVT
jgi:hypothetical protein